MPEACQGQRFDDVPPNLGNDSTYAYYAEYCRSMQGLMMS